jgi:hypothetical protein
MKAKNVENPPLKTAEKWQNLLNFDLYFFLSGFSLLPHNWSNILIRVFLAKNKDLWTIQE